MSAVFDMQQVRRSQQTQQAVREVVAAARVKPTAGPYAIFTPTAESARALATQLEAHLRTVDAPACALTPLSWRLSNGNVVSILSMEPDTSLKGRPEAPVVHPLWGERGSGFLDASSAAFLRPGRRKRCPVDRPGPSDGESGLDALRHTRWDCDSVPLPE